MQRADLDKHLDQWHLLNHEFYQAWKAGELQLEDLRTYAKQYVQHVDAFPRYISATHSQCTDLTARQALLENLIEEERGDGHHPGLWRLFAKGLGVNATDIETTEAYPETATLISEFLRFSNSSYAEGVGALYAYERQVPHTAESKIQGLKDNYQITDADTLKFFEVHLHADEAHSQTTYELIEAMSPAEQEKAKAAATSVAKTLWNFLSGIQAHTSIADRVCETMH